jgi:hypothetical protein
VHDISVVPEAVELALSDLLRQVKFISAEAGNQ